MGKGSGKGERAHFGFKPPLSSSDIGGHKEILETPPPIFKEPVPSQEFDHNVEDVPLIHLLTTYLSYIIIIMVGHIKDFYGKIFYPEKFTHLSAKDGYAPINSGFGINKLTRHVLSP
jgi:hypothetical protein